MTIPQGCHAIIPARYESSRFPGKPLAAILGKPMLWHVFERIRACPELSSIHVATDDERILEAAEELGIPALMTDSRHESGTDRIHEAASSLGLGDEAVVLNIQGDEPALAPGMISQLLEPFRDPEVQVSTLMRRITAQEADNVNLVKVIASRSGRALYFSRAKVPHHSRPSDEAAFWGHIGLYAYRWKALQTFCRLGPSPLEQTEKLEQLRLLEANIPIHIRPTEHVSHGVDSPEDIPVVERIIRGGKDYASSPRP